MWEPFRQQPHAPCFANRSVWGSNEPRMSEALRQPDSHGWHLDRAAFDRLLLDEAVARGAQLAAPAWSFASNATRAGGT